jgi:Spy/CpxP family protein refolding chaperone
MTVIAGSYVSIPCHAAGLEPVLVADKQQGMQRVKQGRSVSLLFDELELTADQRASCSAQMKRGWDLSQSLRSEARETWHQLMAALRNPDASLDETLALQRKLSRLQQTLAEKRLETWFAMRRLLTTEQLNRLSDLRPDSTLWIEDDNGEPRNAKQRRNDVP